MIYHFLIKRTGHENEGNDHQRLNALMFKQILLTSNISNISRENIKKKVHDDTGVKG